MIAKEGADGLLGLAIQHDDFPDGLGVVIKIAHGWNAQATWYLARGILGVLGFELRNPYALRRQKLFWYLVWFLKIIWKPWRTFRVGMIGTPIATHMILIGTDISNQKKTSIFPKTTR